MNTKRVLKVPINNRLTTLTGPSGVGKGTLIKNLLKRHPFIWLSISATTRSPRRTELNGKDYFFLNHEEFRAKIIDKELLEWAEFSGNYYGTPREPVNYQLAAHRPVLLEIELEGARQIRSSFPSSFQIFISPPSFEELEYRIRARKTDSEESISKRLLQAHVEINSQKEFNAVLINKNLENSLSQLETIMGL
uniref:guanylate kinase n=1 Tax=Paulinella chromatophora TaxID=39717 RepID=B1X5F4_PAUCH|nr:Guanylate kinase [Paulinella chromatophora]ACB43173.1 Guanylate kinase [Paulinella chromatophora]